jgi:hypothetical protein
MGAGDDSGQALAPQATFESESVDAALAVAVEFGQGYVEREDAELVGSENTGRQWPEQGSQAVRVRGQTWALVAAMRRTVGAVAGSAENGLTVVGVFFFWKALLKIRSTQNGRRPTPYGVHRNWTSRR